MLTRWENLENMQYICARCAAKGTTCCHLGWGDEVCFPLSDAELGRILPFVADLAPRAIPNLPPDLQKLALLALKQGETKNSSTGQTVSLALLDALLPQVPNSTEFISAMHGLFPLEKAEIARAFPPDGSHRQMASPKAMGCAFLSAEGCMLPREARPWYCRLFPFWILGGKLNAFQAEGCLAVQEERSIKGLLQCFGTTANDVVKMFAALKIDWGITRI